MVMDPVNYNQNHYSNAPHYVNRKNPVFKHLNSFRFLVG